MTTPAVLVPLGASRDEDHVYGYNDGTHVWYPIPSVTTVIKVVDKSEPLVGWAKREVAKAAVEKRDLIGQMVAASGTEATINWLKTIPGYQRDVSADLGSRVHRLAELINRGQTPDVTADEAPFVAAYLQWISEAKPRWLAAEEKVFSLRHGYAGTLDCIGVIDGETWLLDVKTGSNIYPEVALQLAAYGNAQFVGRLDTPRKFRIPRPSRYGVIHVRPEGARLREYRVTETTFRAFLMALRLFHWTKTEAKTVMGDFIKHKEGIAA